MDNNEEKEVIIENVKYSIDENGDFVVEEKIEGGFKRITPPEFLYRICDFNDNTIDSIVDNYLWAAERSTLNDPLEFENPIFGDYSEEFLEKIYTKIEGIKDEDKRRDKENIKLNSYNIKIIIKQYQRIYDKQIGITSFYELPKNKEAVKEFLMWSHYGNGHTGLRIKYNSDRITNEEYNISEYPLYLYKILYTKYNKDSYYMNELNAVNSNPMLINYANVFIKNDIWSYENEWRLLSRGIKESRKQQYILDTIIDEITFGRYFFRKFAKNMKIDKNLIILDLNNYVQKEFSPNKCKVDRLFSFLVNENIKTTVVLSFYNDNNISPDTVPITITKGNDLHSFFIDLEQGFKKVYTNQRLSSQELIKILLKNFKNPDTLLM